MNYFGFLLTMAIRMKRFSSVSLISSLDMQIYVIRNIAKMVWILQYKPVEFNFIKLKVHIVSYSSKLSSVC